jgi:hypothetical protein
MTMHLQRFVDRVRAFESRGAKDFTMPMTDAKDLHADITRLLITLQTLQESQEKPNETPGIVEVQIQGGTFR